MLQKFYCSALLNTLRQSTRQSGWRGARRGTWQMPSAGSICKFFCHKYITAYFQTFLPQIYYSRLPNFFATNNYRWLPNFFATNILQPTSKLFCHKYTTVYFQIFSPQIYWNPFPNFFATNQAYLGYNALAPWWKGSKKIWRNFFGLAESG